MSLLWRYSLLQPVRVPSRSSSLVTGRLVSQLKGLSGSPGSRDLYRPFLSGTPSTFCWSACPPIRFLGPDPTGA